MDLMVLNFLGINDLIIPGRLLLAVCTYPVINAIKEGAGCKDCSETFSEHYKAQKKPKKRPKKVSGSFFPRQDRRLLFRLFKTTTSNMRRFWRLYSPS